MPVLLMGALSLAGGGRALVQNVARVEKERHGRAIFDDDADAGLPFGPYGVRVAEDVLLRDARRGRDLPVTVVAPRDGVGPFPVIVFSHGAGGDGNRNQPLTRFWASHGYVVLCPTHSDAIVLQRQRAELASTVSIGPLDGGPGDDGETAASLPFVEDREMTTNARRWLDRAEDLRVVLDSAPDLEKRVAGLSGRMDLAHVGVGGESWLGATTAALAGGSTLPGGGDARPGSDPRVAAVLLMSRWSDGPLGLPSAFWSSIPRPLLAITGPKRRRRPARSRPEDLVPPPAPPSPDHLRIRIQGSYPLTFGGDCQVGAGTSPVGFFPYVEEASLAFWDSRLKGDARARATLASGADSASCGVTATVEPD